MATTVNYASTPRCGQGQVATANTNRDGTGTLGNVFAAGASGSRIDSVKIVATGTTTAGVVRLFIYDGTNNRLLSEHLVGAITPSTTVEVYNTEITYENGLILPTNYILKASTNNAETFNLHAIGGDY